MIIISAFRFGCCCHKTMEGKSRMWSAMNSRDERNVSYHYKSTIETAWMHKPNASKTSEKIEFLIVRMHYSHNTLRSIHNFQWMRTRFVYSLDAHHMMTMTNDSNNHKMWVNDLPKISIKTHHTFTFRYGVIENRKRRQRKRISKARRDVRNSEMICIEIYCFRRLAVITFGDSFTMRRSRSVVHRMPYVVRTSYNVLRHPSPECKNIHQIFWFKAIRVRDWTIREVKSPRRKIELRNWFLTF